MDPRQFTVSNTLVCLLQGTQGRRVQIELKNGTSIVGILDSCDAVMNCSLGAGHIKHQTNQQETTKPTRKESRKLPHYNGMTRFDHFYVQGKHIRYVHLPENISIYGVMHEALTQQAQLHKPVNVKKGKDQQRLAGRIETLEPIIGGDLSDLNF